MDDDGHPPRSPLLNFELADSSSAGGGPDSNEELPQSPGRSAVLDGAAGAAGGHHSKATSTAKSGDWDRQSTGSEVSLACLQDRIVQMEETHYSTNEELQVCYWVSFFVQLEISTIQATLQELTDLQDTVNELIQENRQLSDEKSLLYETACKQSSKMDNYRLQIENLKHLLLSGTNHCITKRFSRPRLQKTPSER